LSALSDYYQVEICGQVQGVGFRPFVYQVAKQLALIGTVYNHGQGVTVLLKSHQEQLAQFCHTLASDLPPLASIEKISEHKLTVQQAGSILIVPTKTLPAKSATSKTNSTKTKKEKVYLSDLTDFSISLSQEGSIDTQIAGDAATCSACVCELLDTKDKRFRYPFINCTHCGPRFSIIESLPYDRPATTMKDFTLCESCQDEYDLPTNRRFHAQPNACPSCGPSLTLFKTLEDNKVEVVPPRNFADKSVDSGDQISATITLIKQGKVIAIKGIGGYHLVCDAHNASAVERIRAIKQRKTKPLSVMMANTHALTSIVKLSNIAIKHLTSAIAPIVLVKKNSSAQAKQLENIAPNLNNFGVMLPYTPIHHLLFQTKNNQGEFCQDESLCLVMTSANVKGEPLIYQEQDLHKLASLSDYILSHNRVIAKRIDDSIINCANDNELSTIIRRARGMTPKAIHLPKTASPAKSTLAVGGLLKNSFCLTKGNKAYLSQYIGDLSNPENCRYLQQSIQYLMDIFEIQPEQVACDLHPDFYSSQFAEDFAQTHNIELIKVQHHHAHCAAIACEQQLNDGYLALSLDGIGLGNDNSAWGGECFFIEHGHARRLGHLTPITMPGGDMAAKHPWRIACAFLQEQGFSEQAQQRFAKQSAYSLVAQMVSKKINCPTTSSAGRLFDLAGSLLGLSEENSFEAETAMLLESFADSGKAIDDEAFFTINNNQLNMTPLLVKLPFMNSHDGAATFHSQLAIGLTQLLTQASKQVTQCKNVVLSGGCFLNQRLTVLIKQQLTDQGYKVFCAEQVSPNDSSLSLGQAWVAIEQQALKGLDNNTKEPQGNAVCA